MSEEKQSRAAAAGRSWREIRQDVSTRAMSSRGRRRQRLGWLKFVALSAIVGCSAWGVYSVAHAWESDRAKLATAVQSAAVKEIVVHTQAGGVLDPEWVGRTLSIPRNTSLMALDLAALRAKLTAHRQIRVAVLTRSFPDTLVVNLEERTPVARLQVEDSSGPRQLLVARDGVVYEGFNYDRAMVSQLPWLDGISLKRAVAGGFEPLVGMDAVADLLSTAQLQAPWLYRDWQIVSLERFTTRGELIVRSASVPEIIFSRREDFFRQIAQLDLMIDSTQEAARRDGVTLEMRQANLSITSQISAQCAQTPEELAAAAGRGPARPNNSSLQPRQQRKGQRAL